MSGFPPVPPRNPRNCIAADHCGIQFRTLNSRKGPAVRATRAQIDRAADAGDGLLSREPRRRMREVSTTGRSLVSALSIVAELVAARGGAALADRAPARLAA